MLFEEKLNILKNLIAPGKLMYQTLEKLLNWAFKCINSGIKTHIHLKCRWEVNNKLIIIEVDPRAVRSVISRSMCEKHLSDLKLQEQLVILHAHRWVNQLLEVSTGTLKYEGQMKTLLLSLLG